MKYDVYCVGLKRVYYIGYSAGEEAYEYERDTCVEDVLCCYVDDHYKSKFEIGLKTIYDWCGSGYTTATCGEMDIRRWVTSFGPLTHVPKDHNPIKMEDTYYDSKSSRIVFEDDNEDGCYEVHNNLFDYDADGGDSYYPCGGARANYLLFDELQRAFKDRPVWIFHGESATGKSTLANLLGSRNKEVYETDSAKNGVLPDELLYDIIVIGNKWPNITLDEVRKRIKDTSEIIEVGFHKTTSNDK